MKRQYGTESIDWLVRVGKTNLIQEDSFEWEEETLLAWMEFEKSNFTRRI